MEEGVEVGLGEAEAREVGLGELRGGELAGEEGVADGEDLGRGGRGCRWRGLVDKGGRDGGGGGGVAVRGGEGLKRAEREMEAGEGARGLYRG